MSGTPPTPTQDSSVSPARWVPTTPPRTYEKNNSHTSRKTSRSPARSSNSLSPKLFDTSPSRGAGNELAEKLKKRAEKAEPVLPTRLESKAISWALNTTAEFCDFTRHELEELYGHFQKVDVSGSGYIARDDLRKLLEKLGYPQTHQALSAMMKEVDDDHDGKVNLRQFISIYRMSRKGPISDYKELRDLSGASASIDVASVGVGGAKSFFESKAKQLQRSNEVVEEVKADREARKAAQVEAQLRKQEFKEKMNKFKGSPTHT